MSNSSFVSDLRSLESDDEQFEAALKQATASKPTKCVDDNKLASTDEAQDNLDVTRPAADQILHHEHEGR